MVSSIGSGGFSASAIAQQRQQIFSRADVNGDGRIDAAEIESDLKTNAPQGVLQGLQGKAPTGAEIVARRDADGDGALSQEEFANAKPPQRGKFGSSAASTLLSAQEEASSALLKLFEKSDANGDDDVTENEFTSYINDAVQEKDLTASESFSKVISKLFQSQDTNGDGVVNPLDHQTTTSLSDVDTISAAA